MNEILRRRRALMGKTKSSDPSVLWHTENEQFSGGYISTGVAPCATNADFTILFDITTTTNPTTGDASAYRLFRILYESSAGYKLAFAKNSSTATSYTVVWMGGVHTIGDGTVGTGRHRIVCTHEGGTNVLKVYFRKGDGQVFTAIYNTTFSASSKNLILGQSSGENQLPQGTISRGAVYSRVLSASEINSFLGVSA